jgi:hypothetical protein
MSSDWEQTVALTCRTGAARLLRIHRLLARSACDVLIRRGLLDACGGPDFSDGYLLPAAARDGLSGQLALLQIRLAVTCDDEDRYLTRWAREELTLILLVLGVRDRETPTLAGRIETALRTLSYYAEQENGDTARDRLGALLADTADQPDDPAAPEILLRYEAGVPLATALRSVATT